MRNALYILLTTSLASGVLVANAATGDAQAGSVYSSSANTALVQDASPFLPIRGRDLPLSSNVDAVGATAAAPQASTVEAIPTPTAFQAGSVLLLALAAGRTFRKFRIA
jgi:hypothetical protein